MNQKADRYLDAALQLAGKVGTLPASELGQAAQPALLALQARQLDVEMWLHHLCEWYNQHGLAEVSVHRSEAGLPLVERTAAIALFLAAERAQAAGKEELAHGYRASCLALLHEMIAAGCQIDPPLMELCQQLQAAGGVQDQSMA